MSNPTAEVLRKARARIEQPEAWYHPSAATNETVRVTCTALAIRDESSALLNDEALVAFAKVIGTVAGVMKVGVWNDAPERTHAEVLAAFDKAIAIAEGGAS